MTVQFLRSDCSIQNGQGVQLGRNIHFVAVSVFCFALAVGAIWEILEYTFDDLFGTSTQTYLESTGGSVGGADAVPLVGHEALKDTKWDLILDAAGAVIVAISGFFQLRHEKKGIVTAAFEREKASE